MPLTALQVSAASALNRRGGLGDKELRRQQPLREWQPPSLSEARAHLGKPLSQLLLTSLEEGDRQLMGLPPPLRGMQSASHLPTSYRGETRERASQRGERSSAYTAGAVPRLGDPITARSPTQPRPVTRLERARQHISILRRIKYGKLETKFEPEISETNLSLTESSHKTFGESHGNSKQSNSSTSKGSVVTTSEEKDGSIPKSKDSSSGDSRSTKDLGEIDVPPNSLASSKTQIVLNDQVINVTSSSGSSEIIRPLTQEDGVAPQLPTNTLIEQWLKKTFPQDHHA